MRGQPVDAGGRGIRPKHLPDDLLGEHIALHLIPAVDGPEARACQRTRRGLPAYRLGRPPRVGRDPEVRTKVNHCLERSADKVPIAAVQQEETMTL